MIIKIATFNLFQFCSPEFSFYTKKEKFKKEDWEEKKNWIKEQLQKMDCDIVLKSVANVLKNKTNRADDFAFRVGGEEFVIITHIEKDKVFDYAISIKDDIENLQIEHSGNKVSKYVTISLGIVCKDALEIQRAEDIYKQADDNLYEAKKSGRNCVVIK